MKVFIRLLLFLLLVLPKVGLNFLILGCQSNCNCISIDRFYYNNYDNEYNLIIERCNASIFLSGCKARRKDNLKHLKHYKYYSNSCSKHHRSDPRKAFQLSLGDYNARFVVSSDDYIKNSNSNPQRRKDCRTIVSLGDCIVKFISNCVIWAERGSAVQISNCNVDAINCKVSKAGYYADADANADL